MELSGTMEMFYTLLRTVVTWVNTNAKTHHTEHFRSVHFIKCKLYLNLKSLFYIYQ